MTNILRHIENAAIATAKIANLYAHSCATDAQVMAAIDLAILDLQRAKNNLQKSPCPVSHDTASANRVQATALGLI